MENHSVEVLVRAGEPGVHIATGFSRTPQQGTQTCSVILQEREQVVMTIPGEVDEPAPVLIVRALMELVKRFKLTRYKGGRIRVDSLLIAGTISLCREIQGKSLYPVRYFPKPRLTTPVDLEFTRPQWMDDYFAEYDKVMNSNAMWVVTNSFISGNNAAGVFKTLQKFVRDRLIIDAEPVDVMLAFLKMHLMLGWTEDGLMKPKSYDLADLMDQHVAHDKSAGYAPVHVHQDVYYPRPGERFVTLYAPSLKKQDAKIPAALAITRKYRAVKAIICVMDFCPEIFDPHLYIVKFKQQAMPPGTPPDKVRIFSIPPAEKVLDDSYRMAPFFKACIGRAGVMVGFSWSHGGAHQIAEDMHAYESGWTYFESDFSGLDHSLKAGLIALLSFQHMFYYDNAIDSIYRSMRAMALDSAQQSAVSFIDWQDEDYCRLLIGMILSGEFATSNVDSMYVRLFYLVFDEFVNSLMILREDYAFTYGNHTYVIPFSEVTDKEREVYHQARQLRYSKDRRVESWGTSVKVYGDDTLAANPTILDKYFYDYYAEGDSELRLYPVLLAYYLDRYWDVKLKYTDTFVYPCTTSNPNPFFTEIKDDKIIKRGPKFLQRHFVKYKMIGRGTYTMPWRQTDTYYSKLGCRPADLSDDAVTLAVVRGLKVDTMGTNVTAFKFLDGAEKIILRRDPAVTERMEAAIQNVSVSDLFRNLIHQGIVIQEMCMSSLSRPQILRMFLPDELTPREPLSENIVLT